MAKKNKYEKKAKEKAFLGEVPAAVQNENTTETAKRTGMDTAADAISGIAGGFAGAAMGKYSFFSGLGISALSHAFKKKLGDMGTRLGSLFGIGMITGGVVKATDKGVSGPDDKKPNRIEDAKERMTIFKEGLLDSMHLNKLFEKKKKEEKTDAKKDSTQKVDDTKLPKPATAADTKEAASTEDKTVGEVQYFIYPTKAQKVKEVDLSVLDHVENGLHQSAAEYQQSKQETDGLGEEEETIRGTDEELDPTEKNY